MKAFRYIIFCISAAVLFGNFHASAQTSRSKARVLENDPAVMRGSFDCGIDWYFVKNKKTAGVADFALLQTDTLLVWKNVPLFLGESTLDNISVELFRHFCNNSSRQVLFVAGDVNTDLLKQKLKLLCMLVPHLEPYSFRHNDEFIRSEGIVFRSEGRSVSAEFSSPRISEELMNTGLLLTSVKLDALLEYICVHSLEQAFAGNNISVDSISFDVKREYEHFGPNDYRVAVTLSDSSDSDAAMPILKEILWAVGVGKTTVKNIAPAKAFVGARTKLLYSSSDTDNAAYILRCLEAERFGTSLATNATKSDFICRNIPDSVSVRIFNRYCSHLLSNPGQCSDTVSLFSLDLADTTRFLSVAPTRKKAKMPKVGKDDSIKGVMWTFQNGVKISYRKTKTGGFTYFGVYPALPPLSAQECNLLECCGFTENCFPSEKLRMFIRTLAYITGGALDKNTIIVLVGDKSEDSVLKILREYVNNFYMSNRPGVQMSEFNQDRVLLDYLCNIIRSSYPVSDTLTEESLKTYKTIMTNEIAGNSSSAPHLLESARIRYENGKTITDFAARIKDFTLEQVKEALGQD